MQTQSAPARGPVLTRSYALRLERFRSELDQADRHDRGAISGSVTWPATTSWNMRRRGWRPASKNGTASGPPSWPGP